MARINRLRKPVLLVILDGIGYRDDPTDNAIAQADTPFLDHAYQHFPQALLDASGPAVGLPPGQMGNSEVGHLTLGGGTIVRQDLVKIDETIPDGSFFANPALCEAMQTAAGHRRPIHLLGLVSDGGVHSHTRHLLALIRMCRQQGATPLVHMITDGRDTPPQSAQRFLSRIEPAINDAGGAIATIMGRFYAMDRDQRWERTERAWRALILGKGDKAKSATRAITNAYHNGTTDEFIKPVILPAYQPMQPGDQVVSFNFRKDRPRQIIAAIGAKQFTGFDRGNHAIPTVTCMMPYDKSLQLPFAFEPESIRATLGHVVSKTGLRQFHCAETEKYAHVTYFFNGGRTTPYAGETQLVIPSPKVATYDLCPEMSAARVADSVIDALKAHKYSFLLVNFANGDMVGHTAVKHAAIRAVETVDKQTGRVVRAARQNGYSVIVTADHGNCEQLVSEGDNVPHTQHTMHPVPCFVVDEAKFRLAPNGGLSNVAPTVLQLMGLPQPHEMTSTSLLEDLEELADNHPLANVS